MMKEMWVRWILSENIEVWSRYGIEWKKKMMMKWRWKCIVSVCAKEVCEKKIDWEWMSYRVNESKCECEKIEWWWKSDWIMKEVKWNGFG